MDGQGWFWNSLLLLEYVSVLELPEVLTGCGLDIPCCWSSLMVLEGPGVCLCAPLVARHMFLFCCLVYTYQDSLTGCYNEVLA